MRTSVILSVAGVLAVASVSVADVVSYDQMTGLPSTNWFIPASGGAPTGSGNRQMGAVVNFGGSNTTITGFDTGIVNSTGAAITISANTIIRLNYSVWNTWTPGTGAGTAPAFSGLAGSGTVNFTFTGAGSFANNTILFAATGASGGVGFPPLAGLVGGAGITPINVAGTSGIGIVLSYDLSQDNGLTFTSPNGLTSLITGTSAAPGSPVAPAPTVGTNALTSVNGPVAGYYRSANVGTTDNGGQFAQGSLRNLGTNSGVVLRVFTVPAPATAALLGLGGLVAARRRRN